MTNDLHLRESGVRGARRPEPDRGYERAVLHHLQAHGESEGAILESYRAVAERSSAGEATRFLVNLILDDERRHHQLFAEMANEIRSFVWEVPVEPRLPTMKKRSDPELLAETKRLLAFERNDAKELRQLRKLVKDAPPSSLHPLIVELMLHDTAKHIAILELIKSRLDK